MVGGLLKGGLGLAVRPTAGVVEGTSKTLQGVGLLCLGKRGIQGKLIRRMQAPGVAVTDVVHAARVSAAQAAYQAAIIAAWQVRGVVQRDRIGQERGGCGSCGLNCPGCAPYR